MQIEDFGFEPVVGEEYVVTFTSDGNLLSTSEWNGAPLPAVSFPDNSEITFTVTHKETGKTLMNSEFISYNGKLYKTTFKLPLKNEGTNENANVYIKDLHYDLTTGSVLVQVQGFEGEQYQLTVSDKEMSHEVMAMPITLENDMYYSVPTELVQGAEFEVYLADSHGKSVDHMEFTAPISTAWRHTEFPAKEEEVTLDDPNSVTPTEEEFPTDAPVLDEELQAQTEEQMQTGTLETSQEPVEGGNTIQKPLIFGAIGLILLLIIVLLIRMMKRKKAKKNNTQPEEDDGFEEPYEEYEEQVEEPEALVKKERKSSDDEFPDLDD